MTPNNTRMEMIGQIRQDIEALYDLGHFDAVKEVMGSIDRFNFSGISDDTIKKIWQQLRALRVAFPSK